MSKQDIIIVTENINQLTKFKVPLEWSF